MFDKNFWLAVDKDGTEKLFESYPFKYYSEGKHINKFSFIQIPKGTINKLIGKNLTWEDKPIKYIKKQKNNILE